MAMQNKINFQSFQELFSVVWLLFENKQGKQKSLSLSNQESFEKVEAVEDSACLVKSLCLYNWFFSQYWAVN